MTGPQLKLNFFVIPSPERTLPVHTRAIPPGENLGAHELLWEPNRDAAVHSSGIAVLVAERQDLTGYEAIQRPMDKIAPGTVKALLRCGLEESLRQSGRIVEPEHMGFLCFRQDEVVRENVPPFVVIRRGVEFRPDHLTGEGRRIYGCFVSTRVRIHFRDTLTTDERLGQAALQQSVSFRSLGGGGEGILTAVNRDAGTADILDDHGHALTIALTDTHVPVSPPILSRYCALVGNPSAATSIRQSAQTASYRLGRTGQKNRRWLNAQTGFVRMWLNDAAQYERLSFAWPNSTEQLFMHTRPVDVAEQSIA